jgi:hypothetical protein
MTTWQWAVCGILLAQAWTILAIGRRTIRGGAEIAAGWFGASVVLGGIGALLGYLWNL